MKQQHPDQLIEFFSRHTHSPKGEAGPTEQTYQQLLARLGNQQPTSHRSPLARWRVAASIAMIVGIGIALAGVLYHNALRTPDNQPEIDVPIPTDVVTLAYDNAPLSDIVTDLTEAYHTPIAIKREELCTYRLTATFTTDEPLPDILSLLAEAGSFTVSYIDGVYVIE